jgi:hypothetical protein
MCDGVCGAFLDVPATLKPTTSLACPTSGSPLGRARRACDDGSHGRRPPHSPPYTLAFLVAGPGKGGAGVVGGAGGVTEAPRKADLVSHRCLAAPVDPDRPRRCFPYTVSAESPAPMRRMLVPMRRMEPHVDCRMDMRMMPLECLQASLGPPHGVPCALSAQDPHVWTAWRSTQAHHGGSALMRRGSPHMRITDVRVTECQQGSPGRDGALGRCACSAPRRLEHTESAHAPPDTRF